MNGSVDKHRPKVKRVAEEYHLEGVTDELEHRWAATGEEHQSLRELADFVNKQMLESEIDRTSDFPQAQDVEHIYNVLQSDNVSPGRLQELKRNLDRRGIDIDKLTSDFVSHQAVHSYLRDYQGVEYEASEQTIEDDLEIVQRVRGRLIAVIESIIDKNQSKEDFDASEYGVYIDIRIQCEECQRSMTLVNYFKNRGCDC